MDLNLARAHHPTGSLPRSLSLLLLLMLTISSITSCRIWSLSPDQNNPQEDPPSSKLHTLHDNRHTIFLALVPEVKRYRFEICEVGTLGAPVDGSCINAFRSASGEAITFSYQAVLLEQLDPRIQQKLHETYILYQRAQQSQTMAQVYRGVGSGTLVYGVFDFRTGIIRTGFRQKLPVLGRLLVFVTGGLSLLHAHGTLTERQRKAERGISFIESEQMPRVREMLQPYHNLSLLLTHWDDFAREEAVAVPSIRTLVEDLAHYLALLNWDSPAGRISTYCLPETQDSEKQESCRAVINPQDQSPASQQQRDEN